ncbi:MAG: hypothetical protein M1812_006330 [Candelaria pacifica]|nr:MAG: hypothetical protein M1812_006330 [Candelaria pacifica]
MQSPRTYDSSESIILIRTPNYRFSTDWRACNDARIYRSTEKRAERSGNDHLLANGNNMNEGQQQMPGFDKLVGTATEGFADPLWVAARGAANYARIRQQVPWDCEEFENCLEAAKQRFEMDQQRNLGSPKNELR